MLLAVCGCVTASPKPNGKTERDYYSRTLAVFESATLHKPNPTLNEGLATLLAPLLVVKAPDNGNSSSSSSDGFPAICIHDTGADGPVIYWHEGEGVLNGDRHAQVTFVWFFGGTTPAGPPSMQGVGITLNSAGHPVIWEVLTDRQEVRQLFVAESLEQAAAAHFGPTLPGRRYAIEPSKSEHPGIVVSRVLEDGPVPMGPMVYLAAGTRAISTVLCRCMPAQVKTIQVGAGYELVPMALLDTSGAGKESGAAWQHFVQEILDGRGSQKSLESLRLPKKF
jgi:hypothetical protein